MKPADEPAQRPDAVLVQQRRRQLQRSRLALNVREHLPAPIVESDDARCTVETGVLQMPEQLMDRERPRASLPMHIALNEYGATDRSACESLPIGVTGHPLHGSRVSSSAAAA